MLKPFLSCGVEVFCGGPHFKIKKSFSLPPGAEGEEEKIFDSNSFQGQEFD